MGRRHDLLSLLKTKLAVSALGVAMIAGGGVAALAASHNDAQQAGAQPQRAAATATHTATSQADQTHVSIEGTLMAASVATKGTGTIAVQEHGKSATTQVTINADTRVNGWHGHSLADLAAAKGHNVQVQAIKQKDGSLLAWKITVQGPVRGAAAGQQHAQGQGAASSHAQGHGMAKPATPGAARMPTGTPHSAASPTD